MENKDLLIKKLHAAVKLDFGKILLGEEGVELPEGAMFSTLRRIIFMISGKKKVSLPVAGKAQEFSMRKGDVQLSNSNSWEIQSWDSAHEMICIVPRAEFLRISYYRVGPIGKKMNKQNFFYHTDRPVRDRLSNTVDALFDSAESGSRESVSYLLKAVCTLTSEEMQLLPEEFMSKSEQVYLKIMQLLESSYHEDISREEVAAAMHLSPGYVSQLFKSQTGKTFKEVLTRLKMDQARKLLLETDLNVYQVGFQSGFRDSVHFVRKFRELAGWTPAKYRAAKRK
ncbi:MAG: helix-turn-helix transcriptional regulator [Planctomycetota bacterium]|jgi:AraC-like DNA-binding protein